MLIVGGDILTNLHLQQDMAGEFQGMKVLVTGGAGFIGSNICDALLEKGAEVVCLDNFITGRRINLHHLENNQYFKLIEGDIRDYSTCEDAVSGCTHVCHQAALGSVPRSIEDPITTNAINISGTLNIMVAAQKEGIKRFVFASSSSVYGDEATMPKIEQRTGFPLSPYATTKVVNELYSKVFRTVHGMECIGLRYFNIFGRRQDPEGAYAAVIPKFVDSIIKKEQPLIYGDGEQSRDFTYIENVLQMNLKALATTNEEAFGEMFNVACGSRITINELFFKIRELLGEFDEGVSDIVPIYIEERQGDIKHSLADISKAERLLNYSPSHDCNQGLDTAIEWYWDDLTK
jgi:UDP-N-acetylglucosamine/UDP-N-acetylgalactosamine 4-epimerase